MIVERVKKWILENPERHRQHAIAVKAKRRSAEGAFMADDIADKLIKQQGFCFYCGDPLDDTYEVDHYVPIARGGSHDPLNIVIACKPCNRKKSSKDPEKFIAALRKERAGE
jgi:5-methylcytosine-specific restriction endonuclease McrA